MMLSSTVLAPSFGHTGLNELLGPAAHVGVQLCVRPDRLDERQQRRRIEGQAAEAKLLLQGPKKLFAHHRALSPSTKAAMAANASCQFCSSVRPEALRGVKSWLPSSSQR